MTGETIYYRLGLTRYLEFPRYFYQNRSMGRARRNENSSQVATPPTEGDGDIFLQEKCDELTEKLAQAEAKILLLEQQQELQPVSSSHNAVVVQNGGNSGGGGGGGAAMQSLMNKMACECEMMEIKLTVSQAEAAHLRAQVNMLRRHVEAKGSIASTASRLESAVSAVKELRALTSNALGAGGMVESVIYMINLLQGMRTFDREIMQQEKQIRDRLAQAATPEHRTTYEQHLEKLRAKRLESIETRGKADEHFTAMVALVKSIAALAENPQGLASLPTVSAAISSSNIDTPTLPSPEAPLPVASIYSHASELYPDLTGATFIKAIESTVERMGPRLGQMSEREALHEVCEDIFMIKARAEGERELEAEMIALTDELQESDFMAAAAAAEGDTKSVNEEVGGYNDDRCPICLDYFAETQDIKCYRTECNHRYHLNCLSDWTRNHDSICCICRKPVVLDIDFPALGGT